MYGTLKIPKRTIKWKCKYIETLENKKEKETNGSRNSEGARKYQLSQEKEQNNNK